MFCEGLPSLARTRKLPMLLLRQKATVGADMNMLWKRRDKVQMLKRLRMMDQMSQKGDGRTEAKMECRY